MVARAARSPNNNCVQQEEDQPQQLATRLDSHSFYDSYLYIYYFIFSGATKFVELKMVFRIELYFIRSFFHKTWYRARWRWWRYEAAASYTQKKDKKKRVAATPATHTHIHTLDVRCNSSFGSRREEHRKTTEQNENNGTRPADEKKLLSLRQKVHHFERARIPTAHASPMRIRSGFVSCFFFSVLFFFYFLVLFCYSRILLVCWMRIVTTYDFQRYMIWTACDCEQKTRRATVTTVHEKTKKRKKKKNIHEMGNEIQNKRPSS